MLIESFNSFHIGPGVRIIHILIQFRLDYRPFGLNPVRFQIGIQNGLEKEAQCLTEMINR